MVKYKVDEKMKDTYITSCVFLETYVRIIMMIVKKYFA